MDEFKEGDIVRVTKITTGKSLVQVVRAYPSSVSQMDLMLTDYPHKKTSWYSSIMRLKALTPEEKLELATFGKILEVD